MKNSFRYQRNNLPLNHQLKIVEKDWLSEPGIIQSVLQNLNGNFWFDNHLNSTKIYLQNQHYHPF